MTKIKYIKRHIEKIVKECIEEYKVITVIGPRQVGKTTMLNEILGESNKYTFLTLDDLKIRNEALYDYDLFLEKYKTPLFIDEIQKAPNLFEHIKYIVDQQDERGQFILTGSESFVLMKGVKESLSTRNVLIDMVSLSNSEIENRTNFAFVPDKYKMLERKCKPQTHLQTFKKIINGSMPNLNNGTTTNTNLFYSTYCFTTLFNDIYDDRVKIKDVNKFLLFLKVVASLVGQEVNLSNIAKLTNLNYKTVVDWLDALIAMNVIFLLHPYSNNLLKRTTKMAKLYFYDTGIPCYLMNYTDPEILWNSEYSGHIFECYAISEIAKGYINDGRSIPLYYVQSYDKKEIDLIIEGEGGIVYPIEIKKSVTPQDKHFSNIGILKPLGNKVGPMTLICCATEFGILKQNAYYFPVHWI